MSVLPTTVSASAVPAEAKARRNQPLPNLHLPKLGYPYPVAGLMLAAGIGGFSWVYSQLARDIGAVRFRLDLTPLIEAGWLIQLHVTGAVTAFLLGIVILIQRKGSRLHRKLGWVWVVAMAAAALSSAFIRSRGDFSWIHAFTGVSLIALPMGVAAARMHFARTHARFMTGIFLGGAFTAGLFTFLPGRLMWDVLFTASQPLS